MEIGLWHQGDGQGPRGLIRLFYPIGTEDGGFNTSKLIAVEPVVDGPKRVSELEKAHTTEKAGKDYGH